MTAHHDIDRELTAFLREGPTELPYESFDAVRNRTEQTRQRAFVGPWRLSEMTKILAFGFGAAAVVLVLVVGAQLFGSPSGGMGSQATPTPTLSPEATAEPTPSSTPAPPLTQSFTSTLHGISMSYPEGWTAEPATEPWTDRTFPLEFLMTQQADLLYDPNLTDHLFLTMASQPIGDSTPEDWVAAQMASGEGCKATEPITVDGATGLIGADECNVAVVTTAGRGYWIELLTSGDQAWLGSTFDQAWFEEVLATVQLHPRDAVD
jgi:hypothetical protein